MGVLSLFSLLISVLCLSSVHDAVGRLLGAESPPSKTAELAASLLLVGLGLLVGLFLVRRYPAVGGEGWSKAVASWLGLPSLISAGVVRPFERSPDAMAWIDDRLLNSGTLGVVGLTQTLSLSFAAHDQPRLEDRS